MNRHTHSFTSQPLATQSLATQSLPRTSVSRKTKADTPAQEKIKGTTTHCCTKTSSVSWRIVQALPEDIPYIANHMRDEDKKEVWASHRETPEEALTFAFEHSPLVWTCFIEDIPSFMFGVSMPEATVSHVGVPWLLCTPRIYKMQQDFLRNSQYYVDTMQKAFPRLENIVHAENIISIRWLEWCGFTVEKSFFTSINNEKFYHFWRIA